MNSSPRSPSSSDSRFDRELSAGLVVFLVALPLCLGIALASGAPLFSGIIAGVVGGLIISPLSGSPLSVSGPAAGLAVVVAEGIKQCGGNFSLFCAAVVLAGILQVVFGFLHLGRIGELFPSSVIKGMLAGIGIVIVLKQIPHALGQDGDFEGDEAFFSLLSGNNTVSALYESFQAFSGTATFIALLSLATIIIWDKAVIPKIPSLRALPSALVAVLLATSFHEILRWWQPDRALITDHLVQLPKASSLAEWGALFSFPTITSLLDFSTIVPLAFTIAVIASLETLLSVEAVDKIDPLRRISNTSKELIAQGIGNISSGFIGGLPVTAVIVRSSANVYAGGRTKLAGFAHGVFLLIAVIAIPSLLNRIPLASLAAILIIVGVKLSSPTLIRGMWRGGIQQFVPFAGTILGVVFTDLLKGVGVGLALGLFFVIRQHRSRALSVLSTESNWLIRFNKDMSFIHRGELKDALLGIPDNSSVIIDGTVALYVDPDIRELLSDFSQSAPLRQINIEFRGISL
jgi:MFS superfamily sulfate permease-like transporter